MIILCQFLSCSVARKESIAYFTPQLYLIRECSRSTSFLYYRIPSYLHFMDSGPNFFILALKTPNLLRVLATTNTAASN